MKKSFLCFASLVMVFSFLPVPKAHAQDMAAFNEKMEVIRADRARVASELGLVDVYPHAASYYDDLVDHYEQYQLMTT